MSGALGEPIETEAQARNWIIELVARLEVDRLACDLAPAAHGQRRAYDQYRIRFGQALGTLVCLQRCGRLGDVAYNELRARVMATALPTVIDLGGER
jgi:hypothetical protein